MQVCLPQHGDHNHSLYSESDFCTAVAQQASEEVDLLRVGCRLHTLYCSMDLKSPEEFKLHRHQLMKSKVVFFFFLKLQTFEEGAKRGLFCSGN